MSGNSSRTTLGYVETEEEAKEICNKLNSNMREKNELNSFGWKSYSFKVLKHLSIDDIK